jgi:nickel-dependent lactate racemase
MSDGRMAASLLTSAHAPAGTTLEPDQVARVLFDALEEEVAGEHVLVLVPDRTRNVPLAKLVPTVVQALHKASAVEVMVALGTHPPLSCDEILDMTGMSGAPSGILAGVANHAWKEPGALAAIGTVDAGAIKEMAGPTWHHSLGGDLVVRVNRRALEVDRVVIVGPTLPHEVAGFSGGAKYLFPGI